MQGKRDSLGEGCSCEDVESRVADGSLYLLIIRTERGVDPTSFLPFRYSRVGR